MLALPGFPVMLGARPPDIEFVGASSVEGSTVSIPPHDGGDLILAFAFTGNSAANPSPTDASFEVIFSEGGTVPGFANARCCLAYKFSDGTDASLRFTNAQRIVCGVYRNVASIGARSSDRGASEAYWPAITALRPPSLIVGVGGGATGVLSATPPPGYVQRGNTGGTVRTVIMDTGVMVSAMPQTDDLSATSGAWMTTTLELSSRPE